MVIIIEGIDRVGKTTLSEMIEDKYRDYIGFMRFRDDTRYVHSHLNREVNTEKINTLQNLLEAGFIYNIILDRYHITEFVYGAVERSYKNEDMYDIDKRLAEMDKKDTPDESEEEIDPGIMYDGHIHNDVILIYVVPADIKLSSEEHGYNLERHLKWYNDFYRNTLIKKKITVDYETLGEALEFIDSFINIEDSEGPEIPDRPTRPEPDGGYYDMELKTHRIIFNGENKIFELPEIGVEYNIYINGLYMTKNVDYIVDDDSGYIIFEEVYDKDVICTLTYFVKKED